MRYLVILIALTFLSAQNNQSALSPVVTYWKTLTPEEKEVFLQVMDQDEVQKGKAKSRAI